MEFGPPPEGSSPEQPEQTHQPAELACPRCGSRVESGQRFCSACGAPLPSSGGFCPRCGTKLEPGQRFCTNCGADVANFTGEAFTVAPGSYPVQYEVEYPEKLSRLLIFVKFFLAIPQFLVVYALSSVISVVTFICFFAILFTGRYPRGLFNLVVGFMRWSANVTAYTSFFRDEYPPFAMDPGRYPVTYEVEYPERLSRWLIFFKWLLVIPNQIAVGLLGIVSLFLTFISWWAILFTGRFPRGFFDFNVGVQRWGYRATAYVNLLRDEYPPYSKRSDAKPSGAKAIVIGVVVGALAIAGMIAAVVALSTIEPQTETVVVSYQRLQSGSVSPTARIEGTRVTLTGVEDPADALASPSPGSRFVAFTMTISNEDSLFTLVGRDAFRLKDTSGETHRSIENPLNFDSLAKGERVRIEVTFEIDADADPASLTYTPGFGQFGPFGEKVRFEFR